MSLMRIDNGITRPSKGIQNPPSPGCCNKCRLMDVAPCPIFERAYDNGYEEMEFCEMMEPIAKVWEAAKVAVKMGPIKALD